MTRHTMKFSYENKVRNTKMADIVMYKKATVTLMGDYQPTRQHFKNVYSCGLVRMNDETILRVTYDSENTGERETKYFNYNLVSSWSVTE